MIALGIVAAVRAEWPDRAAVMACFLAWLASIAIVQVSQEWQPPQLGIVAVDLALFLALLVVAVIAKGRAWLFVASGFQLGALGLHLVVAVGTGISAKAYFAALTVTSWLVIAAIALSIAGRPRGQTARRR